MIGTTLTDDHAVVRAGLRRLLDDAPDIEVLAEAGSGEQAYRDYLKHKPDVAIMDLTMPGIGGLEAIRRIRAKDAIAKVLILSVHEGIVFAKHAIQAGALGYVTKRSAPSTLISAVRVIARGEIFLEREIAQELALKEMPSDRDPLQALTTREFEVFRMLAEGQSVSAIATTLFLSPKTVGTYQTRILHKLKVQNLAALARLAIRNGFIEA